MKDKLKHLVKRLVLHKRPTPPSTLDCYIDSVDGLNISGWARNRAEPSHKCHIKVISKDVVLGETIANLPRGDLANQGLEDGHYGYNISVEKNLFLSRIMECYLTCNDIKIPGSDIKLELTPKEYSEIKFRQKYSDQIKELNLLIESNIDRINSIINENSFDCNDESLSVAVGVLVQETAVILSRLTILESYLVKSEKKF